MHMYICTHTYEFYIQIHSHEFYYIHLYLGSSSELERDPLALIVSVTVMVAFQNEISLVQQILARPQDIANT